MNPRERTSIAIVCQGGGSHAAYAAGALQTLLPELDQRDLRLVGISGTSGGAICALLAWYGLLQGGPQCARQKLGDFWAANCAQLPGERLWNDNAVDMTAALPYEIMFNPYRWPLLTGEAMLTQWWPALSALRLPFDLPFNLPNNVFSGASWVRGNFFQLDAMIAPFVDFPLIAALGEFCSIPATIARWREAERKSHLLGGPTAPHPQSNADMLRLEDSIRHSLAKRAQITQMMEENGFSDLGLLRTALAQWEGPKTDAANDPGAWIDAVDKGMADILLHIPKLLLGAVNVGSGAFTAFSSERPVNENGISLQAVLASAALPWLFKAVAIDTVTPDGRTEPQRYWDGLFSQNAPVTNFIADSSNARKPDQFWVLQINPLDSDITKLENDIWDRRNALSGNLSLNQEIAFIGAINRRLDMARATAGAPSDDEQGDKHVQVSRIILDTAAVEAASGKRLGAVSKFDRDPALKDALMRNGADQATHFLRVRTAIAHACADLDQSAYADLPPDCAEQLQALRNIKPEAGLGKPQLMIDEMTLPSTSLHAGGRHHALARWHMRGTIDDDDEPTPVIAKGETEFDFTGNGQFAIRARKLRMNIDELPAIVPSVSMTQAVDASAAVSAAALSRSKGNGSRSAHPRRP